jgi:hypothetical protein
VKRFALLGLALLSLMSMATAGCESSSCHDAGREFADGEQWTCADGCNYCGCDDGAITHTAMGCAEPPGPAAGKLVCQDRGVHRHGEVWVCADGCSECTCSDGDVVTTTKECGPG